MDRATIRTQLRRILTMANFLVKFTPTSLDNQLVATLQHVVDDDELFNGLCDLFGIAEARIAAGQAPASSVANA